MKHLFPVLLLFFSFFSLCQANLSREDDPFRFNEKTFEKARKKDRLIFLFVGSDVCSESRGFLKEIVRNREYFNFVKKKFIVAILDIDLNPSLAIRYNLPTIPGFLILDTEQNIYFGTTRPSPDEAFPILRTIVEKWESSRDLLREELKSFQDSAKSDLPGTVQGIIDSTMNVPNHISLDLGRFILSLPNDHVQFRQYVDQLLDWIKSENYDFVEGSFFMPRGYCTYHAESKYSFFNFKLQEMLLDFYARTGIPEIKQGFLKSMRHLKRDLFLSENKIYSTGYGSKKYFHLSLKDRLLYYPPSPRRSDLALSQVIYLKILYKVSHLFRLGRLSEHEVSFLKDHLQSRLALFSRLVDQYQRDDGLLYFTSRKSFANFETQVEYFSLLQLMQKIESVDQGVFLRKMRDLYESFVKAFFDREKRLFSDIPLRILKEYKHSYQYPLFFTREHARLLLFLDFLHDQSANENYLKMRESIRSRIYEQDEKYPHRFYWLKWYENLLNQRSAQEKN